MPEEIFYKFAADLHVHTALSPCADDSCTPPNIVATALERGMDMIAVTDHNTAGNVEAMARCGRRHGLKVIPGMEVTTREEVHVVCLMTGVGPAMQLQEAVYSALQPGANTPEVFGNQMLLDENGAATGECDRLLIGSTDIALEDLVKLVHDLGGIAIAAHVDRPTFSVMANLGFVPENAGLDALEISAALCHDDALAKFPELERFPIVTASDAHMLDQIGAAPTLFLLREIEIGEIKLALQGLEGREYLIQ